MCLSHNFASYVDIGRFVGSKSLSGEWKVTQLRNLLMSLTLIHCNAQLPKETP